MKKTGYIRISDTVQFKHHINPPPTVTTMDKVVAATNNLVDILNKAAEEVPPTQLEAIKALRRLLRNPMAMTSAEPTPEV